MCRVLRHGAACRVVALSHLSHPMRHVSHPAKRLVARRPTPKPTEMRESVAFRPVAVARHLPPWSRLSPLVRCCSGRSSPAGPPRREPAEREANVRPRRRAPAGGALSRALPLVATVYAFDLLELDGTDLRREPIEVRKATLASILRKSRHGVRLNEHLEHDCGLTVFQHACKMGWRASSRSGWDRAIDRDAPPDWLKF